jgi:ribonuclease HI
VEIYVKASYRQDEKKGSWAVILRKAEYDRVLCGRATEASANALLIRGAAEGLRALTRPCSVMIYSDAGYLIQGASQWIKGWLVRDWQTRDGKPVANRTEWEALQAAMRPHQVSWRLAPAEEQPNLARAGELAAAASWEG